MRNRITLPNGCSLYFSKNMVSGRSYYSDESGGVLVWDTATVDKSTLLAAIVQEETILMKELHDKRKKIK